MRKSLNEEEFKERIKQWETSRLTEKAKSDVDWLTQFEKSAKTIKSKEAKREKREIDSLSRILDELELIEEELQSRDRKYVLTAEVWRGKFEDWS